jgi:hypothetical protein
LGASIRPDFHLRPTKSKELGHVGVDLSEILELDVRRVSNDCIESAALEYLWKRLFPVKCVGCGYIVML